jgi:anti-sigma-K factor RskA
MSDSNDIETLAADYALGVLDGAGRRAAEAQRANDPELAAAIAAWEARLGPLAETVPSVAPPAGLFSKIEARIAASGKPRLVTVNDAPETLAAEAAETAQNVRVLRRRVSQWRMGALSLGAIAAALALGFGLREWKRPPAPKSYVAVLQKDALGAAFLLSVDLETRSFVIRPVSAQPEPGKSFELWLIDSKLGPKSLGVIGDEPRTARASLPYDKVVLSGATYAVTVEPAGGSPNGAPSGPPVFSGQLIEAAQ